MEATIVAEMAAKPAQPSGNPVAEAFHSGLKLTVPTNPALLEFPTDRWGITSELKKAVIKAAGSIKGQKDKHDLIMLTLGILAKHVMARYLTDQDYMREQIRLVEEAASKRPTR